MCRWAAWIGAPIFLDEIVARPGHSLIRQSHDARKAPSSINADGFGLAWYGEREEPGLYRDVYPAWSDPNLRSLVAQVRSRLFMAHVRASTGTAISRNNCHPFTMRNWSFMHNGQIGGFEAFRRDADMLIPDALYPYRKGATDSEALFLIAMAEGLEADPQGAISRAVAQLVALSQARGGPPHLRIAAALSDGHTLYAMRAASDRDAPSLWHRWMPELGGRAVVSEPFDTESTGWESVPPGSFCIFRGAEVVVRPFLTELQAYAA